MLKFIDIIINMSWTEFFISCSIISLLVLLTMSMLVYISNGEDDENQFTNDDE